MYAVGEARKPSFQWVFISFSHCFFLEGVVLPSDPTRLLLLSKGDEAWGGHRFVLLVTLITPWGTSVVPFSSCTLLICRLPADSSALITVFMLIYVTPSQNIAFLGVIRQKQINLLSNEEKRCELEESHQVLLFFLVILIIKKKKKKKETHQGWPCAVDCLHVTRLGKTH